MEETPENFKGQKYTPYCPALPCHRNLGWNLLCHVCLGPKFGAIPSGGTAILAAPATYTTPVAVATHAHARALADAHPVAYAAAHATAISSPILASSALLFHAPVSLWPGPLWPDLDPYCEPFFLRPLFIRNTF